HTRNHGLDQIVFSGRRAADRDEVLLRVDKDEAVARSVARRFCNEATVLRERRVDVLERDTFRGRQARDRSKALGDDLVEGKVRGSGPGSSKGNAAIFAHRLQLAILCPPAMQAEHQKAAIDLRLVKRLADRGADAAAARRKVALERA